VCPCTTPKVSVSSVCRQSELEGVDVMKDKEINLDEIESSHTLDGVWKGRVQGRGKWRGVMFFYFILL
jgi:hypothetical protein